PFSELNTNVSFDPGEGIVLTNGDHHIVGFNEYIGFAGGDELAPSIGIIFCSHFFKPYAFELSFFHDKFFWRHIIQNGNILPLCIFDFPGRSFHVFKRTANNHSHLLSAKSSRSAATIHSSIPASEYDDFFAYFFNMLKSYACQKLDADVNIFFSFFSSGNIEIAPFWRSRSDKYSIVIFLQHLLHAFHKSVEMRVNTHIEDIIHFLIQNRFGKAEGRYLCAHHTTAFVP